MTDMSSTLPTSYGVWGHFPRVFKTCIVHTDFHIAYLILIIPLHFPSNASLLLRCSIKICTPQQHPHWRMNGSNTEKKIDGRRIRSYRGATQLETTTKSRYVMDSFQFHIIYNVSLYQNHHTIHFKRVLNSIKGY